ncbi:hypothetical protein FGRMN_6767 [Fusarium graminum]|nr:hypothetical protein FGRMN_6767 [Fusarium graminum]
MHTPSTPHPSQIRSSCERCRRQKLRCSRGVGPSTTCARCTRLGLTCQPGLQRRVGRPPKKDTAEVVLHNTVSSPDNMQFIQDLLNDSSTLNLDPFCMYTPESLPFPMDTWPAVRELDPPTFEQRIIFPGTNLFDTLSKLNADVYRGWEFVAQFANTFQMKAFVCEDRNMKTGYQNIQLILKSTQKFLVVLKTLHRQLGTREVLCQGRKPHTNRTVRALAADTVSESSFTSSGGTTPTTGSATPQPPPVFDSSTMFLVISCYAQLTKHLEFVLKIIFNSISDPHQDLIEPAPMSFADVPLIEPSTQFILFSEMIGHVMNQINLLMGLPSSWSSKSAWTGLMTCQRYRDMLNVELGAVEDGCTTRPNKVLEINTITKGILQEFSMMGIY